jgi:hypothetical protein
MPVYDASSRIEVRNGWRMRRKESKTGREENVVAASFHSLRRLRCGLKGEEK